MKRTSRQTQFNVRLNRDTIEKLAAVARLRGISQGVLIEELAQPVLQKVAGVLEDYK
jgi:hypothetical protein